MKGRWSLVWIAFLFVFSCQCEAPPQEEPKAEPTAERTQPQERPSEPAATEPRAEPPTAPEKRSEPVTDPKPDATGNENRPEPQLRPEPAPEPPTPTEPKPPTERLSCNKPNPQGCSNGVCPKGQVCWRGYDTKKECYPFSCLCDKQTNTWSCDDNCDGGKCVDPCVANTPDVTCCKDGKEVKPDCKAGVFSCPAGIKKKPMPGCGAYTGSSERGVRCVGNTCSSGENCCFSGAVLCSKTVNNCFATVLCDGPEDCSSGSVCCARFSTNTLLDTWCATQSDCLSQPSGRWVVCRQNSDCPKNFNCCKTTLNPGSEFGVCMDQPC